MPALVTIQRDRYHDSVRLMRLTLELERDDGIDDAIVVLATAHNKELLVENGYSHPELASAGSNDLVIAVRGETLALDVAALEARVAELLSATAPAEGSTERPATLDAALTLLPAAQLVLLSVPGEYAAREARHALARGCHVMIFSDNVSLEDEIALKTRAAEAGLLVMGPDCGTAIISGKPLAFANAVRRGSIGIVGASGTGIQEVSACIDRLGGGVSHALGTGGRDLSEAVGGRTMLAGIAALAADDDTEVIVAISKPPAAAVAERVIAALKETRLPAVVHFVGAEPRDPEDNVFFVDSLAAAAESACELAGLDVDAPATHDEALVAELADKLPADATLCGLFCGGTTGYEALVLLERAGQPMRSNLHKGKRDAKPGAAGHDGERRIDGEEPVAGDIVLDLGDDVFTRGRPHPMIEPELRNERLLAELEAQADRGLLLFDVVLGYGSHADPAGLLASGLNEAKQRWPERSWLCIASITGTEADPQSLSRSRRALEEAGVLVLADNRRACELAAAVLAHRRSR